MNRPMKGPFKPRFQKPHHGGGGPPGGPPGRSRAPDSTWQEVNYLKRLIERQTPVCVRLRTNEEVRGVLEYYDAAFVRLTRQNAPNLFIFKHEIKYIYEESRPPSRVSPPPSPPPEPPQAEEEADS